MAKDNNKADSSQEILKPQGAGKARLIAIIMVILAIIIGTRSSLMGLRREALSYFTDGDPSNKLDYGIQYDLDERVKFANHMIVVGKRYLGENDAFIANILNDSAKLQKATDPSDKFKYNEQLGADCYALLEYLDKLNLAGSIDINDTDMTLLVEAWVDMESSNQKMGHSSYNTKAREFNAILEQFPTNITRLIAFVKPLTLFDY
ncbi:MAG: hypothetical protein J5822_03720 [Eubacteriaceae bacterium]|nr:hypothetical protein [Eubacteriaceae bacterium]